MSGQNRTAPRWQDVPEEARESVRMWLGSMRRAQADVRDDARFTSHARQTADDDVRAIDAALARLAEPATAAERWRAVPAHAREALIAELETDCDELASAFGVNSAGKPWADHAAATAALLALAREAEGGT